MIASMLILVVFFAASNSFAQTKTDTGSMMDCCMMKDGKMMQMKSGKMMPMEKDMTCLLYTSPSPRDRTRSRMPSSA